jgi:hypothetical protein
LYTNTISKEFASQLYFRIFENAQPFAINDTLGLAQVLQLTVNLVDCGEGAKRGGDG